METHYVCAGRCGTVSDNPGICTSEGCPDQNKPLTACSCDDDKHADVLRESAETLDSPELDA